jgi:very-short-patch-repair endonuclease
MHHLKPSRQSNRRALLAARAQQLRSALNHPQEKLWRAVAGGRVGVYFRREVPLLGRFIVDMQAARRAPRARARRVGATTT